MKGSATPLRVLLVEDSENDALLLLRELRRGGYEPEHQRVSTPDEMKRALGEASERGRPWQLVISDHQMPRFGAPDALDLLRELGYDTPFVVVSGKIGEDAAVAMLRAGAQDYVAEENMARLCAAIERELREAREAERNRIARDLHDDILQDIVYALQEVQIAQAVSEDGGAQALEETAEALRRSVEGLRGAIFELRLRETLGRSFVSSLEVLVDLNRRMARRGYELELIVNDGFPRALSERGCRELVRIAQEALANVRRHAEARHARVRLWREDDLARLEVADDGRGFDAEKGPGVGVGQQSMRQRALELGGVLEVESQPGRGTHVRFEAPVSRLVGG